MKVESNTMSRGLTNGWLLTRLVGIYVGWHGFFKAVNFPDIVASTGQIDFLGGLGVAFATLLVRAAILAEVALATMLILWPSKAAKLALLLLILTYTAGLMVMGLRGAWANQCPCGVEVWGSAMPVWGAVIRNILLGCVLCVSNRDE